MPYVADMPLNALPFFAFCWEFPYTG
jgi:hypothetical protein